MIDMIDVIMRRAISIMLLPLIELFEDGERKRFPEIGFISH